MSTTNLTELAEFFPSHQEKVKSKTRVVTAVSPRFIRPGDTAAQPLARQQESFRQLRLRKEKKT